jgi:hypothetical protein
MNRIIDNLSDKERNEELTIISGDASGADTWAEIYATYKKYNLKVFTPEWDKFGKKAGIIRNKAMIDEADLVIAFWDGKSKGTKFSIDYTRQNNIPLQIIGF